MGFNVSLLDDCESLRESLLKARFSFFMIAVVVDVDAWWVWMMWSGRPDVSARYLYLRGDMLA